MRSTCNFYSCSTTLAMFPSKKTFFTLLILCRAFFADAQAPFHILQNDTIISAGTSITLSIDTTRVFSNFIFSARNPETNRWTIWRKTITSHKYEPLFSDKYNRCHVKVSDDKKEMVYVRYKPSLPGAMHSATMDSAWVCRGATNGTHEAVLFVVPQFAKNAIYDLDWSEDKSKIIFALGNDAYPNLTRDGDIFEYSLLTGQTENRTKNWELWSKFCRYLKHGLGFAYTHYSSFWYSNPSDIFIMDAFGKNEQETNSAFHTGDEQFCTITCAAISGLIYRRGGEDNNKLYLKDDAGEHLLSSFSGKGGIELDCLQQLIIKTTY